MFEDQQEEQVAQGFAAAMALGSLNVPLALLKYYSKLSLNETDLVVLLQLMAFQQTERNDLPTLDQLAARTSLKPDALASVLHKLSKNGWLGIATSEDSASGMYSDRYDLLPLWHKISQVWSVGEAMEAAKRQKAEARASIQDGIYRPGPVAGAQTVRTAADVSTPDAIAVQSKGPAQTGSGKSEPKRPMIPTDVQLPPARTGPTKNEKIKQPHPESRSAHANLFTVFEEEFARPLSPMECENISLWLDKDKLSESMIMLALREAVFNNKVNFRYIDKILLEWKSKNLQTIEDVKKYQQQRKTGGPV